MTCVVAALTLAACDSARSDLGTSSSPCFVALPTANGAVHGAGRLVGVRLFTVGSLRRQAPHAYADATSAGAHSSDHVCLVAYEGRFTAPAIQKPRGRPAGKFAVVIVAYPSTRLLTTVIFRRVPLRFGHFLLGI